MFFDLWLLQNLSRSIFGILCGFSNSCIPCGPGLGLYHMYTCISFDLAHGLVSHEHMYPMWSCAQAPTTCTRVSPLGLRTGSSCFFPLGGTGLCVPGSLAEVVPRLVSRDRGSQCAPKVRDCFKHERQFLVPLPVCRFWWLCRSLRSRVQESVEVARET